MMNFPATDDSYEKPALAQFFGLWRRFRDRRYPG
jgi:hypothetical protein